MNQPDHDMGHMIHERIGGARVGDLLRRRRAELGQDISVVAKSLRIRQRYLEAIEDGRLGDLPGPTYVLGFVRSYAEHLGFDGTKIISEFRQEVGVAGPPTPMNWKSQTPPGGGKAGMVLVLVILAGLSAGWYFLGAEIAPRSLIDTLPEFVRPRAEVLPPESSADATAESTEPDAGEPMAPVTEGSVGEADTNGETGALDGSAGSDATTSSAPALAGSEPEASAEATAAISQAPAADQSTPEASAPAVASTSQANEVTATAPEEATPGPRMIIRARLESWVEITNAKQEILVSRVLRAGETFVVPNEPGLVLNTGNAGGLDVEIDGRMAPSLGSIGLVRRGIPLDPALIAGGQTQQAPDAPSAPLLEEPALEEPVAGD